MADDLPVDYNPLRITVTPGPITNVPAGLPVQYNDIDPLTGNPIPSAADLNGPDKLAGFVPWWQRMAVSGATAPGDAYAGRLSVESPTGYPGSIEPTGVQMEPRALPKMLGMGNFTVPSSESEIARVQDTAGMAGMSGIGMTPKGALGTAGSKATLAEERLALENLTNKYKEKGVTLDVTAPDYHFEPYTLSWIESKGLEPKAGTKAIKELAELADKNNKEIHLTALADSEIGGQYLPKYYEALGFEKTGEMTPDGPVMIRKPGSKIDEKLAVKLLEDTRAATGIGAINQSGFYSNLERTIANSKVDKATPEQWTSYLKNQPGIKSEELEFGLSNLPNKVLSKAELEQHIAENGVKLGEVWKGDLKHKVGEFGETFNKEANKLYGVDYDKLSYSQKETVDYNVNQIYATGPTKYSSYQLPGGNNYRELLLTVPTEQPKLIAIGESNSNKIEELRQSMRGTSGTDEIRKQIRTLQNENDAISKQIGENPAYKSSHWDEPNVLAHIRMNDRDIPNVGKSLHIEEVQSDWHQAGRKQGYKGLSPEDIQRKEILDKKPMNEWSEKDTDWYNATVNDRQQYGVPNAPFKKSWDELALKRVLTEAVKNNYDSVSWTPGEAQAARYDLSKHYDNIEAVKRPDTGNYNIFATQKGKKTEDHIGDNISENKLADIVGKELAEKIIKQNGGDFSGIDLKVGGEGMKAFYDKMLVQKADNIVKKMGGKVEYEHLPFDKKKINYNDIRPDEEAQSKYHDEWAANINKIRELRDTLREQELKINTATRQELKNINQENYFAQKKELSKLEIEQDQIHKKSIDETYERVLKNAKGDRVPIIRITPAMREKIKNEGFPLFTAPVYVPVNDDPFEKKLIKVDHNPFIDESSF